jgi:DNA-binding response OmpR family regulator
MVNDAKPVSVTTPRLNFADRTLLLVEDDASCSLIMARLLTRIGFTVETADCVGSALAVLDRRNIDVMISDIDLLDGNGHELMSALRARCGTVGIALTGFDAPEDSVKAAEAGFSRLLVKPIDFKVLENVLWDLMPV